MKSVAPFSISAAGTLVRVGSLACVMSSVACNCGDRGAESGASGTIDEATGARAPGEETGHPRVEREPEELRVATLTVTEVGPGESAIARGEVLEPGRIVSAEGDLTLDFDRSGRIEVASGARVARSRVSPAGVVIGEGELRAILPPEGNSSRPPLRITTPRATIEIGSSGELFAAVMSDGTTLVVQLHGASKVYPGAIGEDGRLEFVPLRAGDSVNIDDSVSEITRGPGTVEAARTLASRSRRSAGQRSAASTGARQEELTRSLRERVQVFDEALHEGRELRTAHRAAVAEHSSGALELQRRIVGHTQALLRARQAVQLIFEHAEALALVSDGGTEFLDESKRSAGRALRFVAADAHRPGSAARPQP